MQNETLKGYSSIKFDIVYIEKSPSHDLDISSRAQESFSVEPTDKQPSFRQTSAFESQSHEMGRGSQQDDHLELITLTPTTIHELIKWINEGEKLLQLQREQLTSEHPSLSQLTMARPARSFCKTWRIAGNDNANTPIELPQRQIHCPIQREELQVSYFMVRRR
jgi:hypothetical protein